MVWQNGYLPWLSLGYITFYYSIFGFLSAIIARASGSPFVVASGIAIAIAFASVHCLFITISLGLRYGWPGVGVGVVIWILCILFIFAYFHAKKKLENKSIGKWKQFFIVAGTSLLGLFLGWLGYQFFRVSILFPITS